MDLMSESVRHSWENRYRDEYDRLADNCVLAKSASSSFITSGETKQSFVTDDTEGLALGGSDVKTGDLDANNDGTGELEPDANISNALMDKIYFQLVRAGAGPKHTAVRMVVRSSQLFFHLKLHTSSRQSLTRFVRTFVTTTQGW